MSQYTVLLEARPFGAFDKTPIDKLNAMDIELIDMRGLGVEDSDFVAALEKSDAILCGNELIVDDSLFQMAPKLHVVGKIGTGIDNVDVDSATRHDAIVFHTPGVNNDAVADFVFALILNLARKIPYLNQSMREKKWLHTKVLGVEIWKKTLGLIGLGAIGRCVALRAKGFQMKVVAYDPFWPEAFASEQGIEKLEIDDLLKVSDFVSLHIPLLPETQGLINEQSLQLMKSSALLINAARGGIVNESDLYLALKDKVIAGAGLDVFETEPPFDSPLFELDNVVASPHTAFFTHEAMNAMSMGLVDQLAEFLEGKKPVHVVNPQAYDKLR